MLCSISFGNRFNAPASWTIFKIIGILFPFGYLFMACWLSVVCLSQPLIIWLWKEFTFGSPHTCSCVLLFSLLSGVCSRVWRDVLALIYFMINFGLRLLNRPSSFCIQSLFHCLYADESHQRASHLTSPMTLSFPCTCAPGQRITQITHICSFPLECVS